MNTIKDLFAPHDIAKLAKEHEFLYDCIALYNYGKLEERNCVGFVINKKGSDNLITAPLWSQLCDFFREEHQLEIVVQRANDFKWYKYSISQYGEDNKVIKASGVEYETFYEAMKTAIETAFKLI